MLRHGDRFERPVPIPRHPQFDIADFGRHGLGCRTVARVATVAAGRVVGFVSEMILEFDLQAGLEHLPDHRSQQAALTREINPLDAGTVDQPNTGRHFAR